METLIRKYSEIGMSDLPTVGGKNASLGEMHRALAPEGVNIPEGFVVTATAFKKYLEENNLIQPIQDILKSLDRINYKNLPEVGMKIRNLIKAGEFSAALIDQISRFYKELGKNKDIPVAVRSSATAEDLPDASFAGQHESYLNITGIDSLLQAVKNCFASLYTNRAIKYREDKGFDHNQVFISVGIQQMIRADMACSGIAFTLEPESGHRNVIHISGVWGLGESIVQGNIDPDEFILLKPGLEKGKYAILQKKLGDKNFKMVFTKDQKETGIVAVDTEPQKRNEFVLTDEQLLELGRWCLKIEKHYKKPMDIEWAIDGISGKIYIIQARPETVHSAKKDRTFTEYHIQKKTEEIVSGNAVGRQIAIGKARILKSPSEIEKIKPGEILVTENTSPDWDPVLKKTAAIITNRGGRTSHAAIVARELGVPAITGTHEATKKIKDGDLVSVSCAEGSIGHVYKGAIEFSEKNIDFGKLKLPSTEVKFILSDPERAFSLSLYPNNGVGLLRMEFIITHMVRIHPMALVNFNKIQDKKTTAEIEEITRNYTDKKEFFVDKLAEGLALIAGAFYPKEVILRLSDFKSNEYANLIGGSEFEPKEENPMLGLRGAARYYHPLYREGFKLECEAIKKLRDVMGLDNVKIMVPFCRTVKEGKRVLELLHENGLARHHNGLEVYMMVEIPSNVIRASEFVKLFDGFSIGSNDLTQLILGVDRDSEMLAGEFSESDPAVLEMIASVIKTATNARKKIGLCGQAPSDSPDFANFLVQCGINSISFNPDVLLSGIKNLLKGEEEKERMKMFVKS
ncbi:phosphoenolpyruvate synthase [Christiangramia fulva]|uniref:Phosphoenolpyruvate synthase n=1 Tax=Christiangramia fulva TaxID=2126553 RepID=A0A2R3Z4B2_9FLAO|nr:phosphoenolpyruvate synthase [Christiangramia fulva]AVR45105.1 phosphoenolpyruvate synthase [Christiangramia fulva]